MTNQLTIVAPAYNEALAIEQFYRELRATVDALRGRYTTRILFVIDRSTDDTLEIARGLALADAEVQVLAMSSRFGHQMSLLAGIDHAIDADVVITMDSDLEHPPSVIPELLDRFEEGYDIVHTQRFDNPDVSFGRRFASRLFYRLIGSISDVPVATSGADFRLISGRVAAVFRSEIRERNQFVRGLVGWVGFRSCIVEYVPGRRAAGRTKYSYGRMLRLAVDGIVSFSRRPLQVSIYLGLVFAGVAFLLGVFSVVSYFVSSSLPPGWATLSVLLTFFSGVQLISLGMIGEYVGTVFDEVKRRPHYIVAEAINISSVHGAWVVQSPEPRAR
jgi:polyisoprenyl-phosphate glycosyltransferase